SPPTPRSPTCRYTEGLRGTDPRIGRAAPSLSYPPGILGWSRPRPLGGPNAMKLIRHFDHFLSETVNLNRSRLDSLDGSVDAVYAALRADPEIGDPIVAKIPQGSWAHRTIIKPLPGN